MRFRTGDARTLSAALRQGRGWCVGLAAALCAAPAGAAITGVCPDGSIFIVQSADAIPCSQAKRVEPSDVPPLQPERLPRPYGWERFQREADPNNPYNLIGAGRAPSAPPPAPTNAPAPGVRPPAVAPAPVPQVAAVPPAPPQARGVDLGLHPDEVRDLDAIVQLMQDVAPATVARYDDRGAAVASVALAHSPAFEQRLRAALPGVTGPVVLFRAVADTPASFHGNLTFVQGHVAFHPDPANPAQLGLLDGRFGPLSGGARVLGYAVLPAHLDPAQPFDIYWNDRRVTATLRP
ncbi:MAG: hypothetical protein AAF430_16055 [Myxococcota bacterium]